MELQGIVFDWGGIFTLGTFDGQVVRTISEQYRVPLSHVSNAYFARVEKLELGEWDLEMFFEDFSRQLNVEDSYEAFEALFLAAVNSNWPMYDLLAALPPELQVGLLSNNYPVISNYLRAGGRFDRFDAVIFSNEVGVKKPDRSAFELIDQRLSAPATAVLFVDDNPANLEAAEAFGYIPHLFLDTQTFVRTLARYGVRLP